MIIFSSLLFLHAQSGLTGYQLKPNNVTIAPVSNGLSVVYHPNEWPNVGFVPKSPWDWSNARALEFDATNLGKSTVNLGVRFDDELSADGYNHSRTGNVDLSPSKSEHIIIVFGPDPMSVGMRGLPPVPGGINASAGGGAEFSLKHIVALQFFLHNVVADTRLNLTNFKTVGGAGASLTGIVDAFGQYTNANWPGKVHTSADLADQLTAEVTVLKKKAGFDDRDRFGGDLVGPRFKGTGFFRTEKVSGKWWFIDPDGRLFFSFGVDTMIPDESTFITGRERMFTSLPKISDPLSKFRYQTSGMHSGPVTSGDIFNFYGANLYRKYGAEYLPAWRERSLERLTSWGFNTVGNWSDEGFYRNGKVPYVATGWVGGSHARLSSGSDYWSTMHDPFDPQFTKDVAESLSGLVAKVKEDPWCLGYFVDNELSWAGGGPDGRYGLALGALKSDSKSPGKAAFVQQLTTKYVSIDRLNAEWGTTFKNWEALQEPITLKQLTDGQRADCSVFVKRLGLRYFSIIRDELKRLDPNHLYLGCRFAWYGPEVEQAAAEVCDVISYNIYAPRLDPKQWSRVAALNKPCIIGEFHFGALDRGMFHPGLVSTPNQAARAAMYEDYVRSVLTNASFVGCHWFQYVDEPLTGRSFDGENYNIGLVSVTDTPYAEMIQAARKVQGKGYQIRKGP